MVPQPSDELLAEAARRANDELKLPHADCDVKSARFVISKHNTPRCTSTWALLVIGYVTVAMRGAQ